MTLPLRLEVDVGAVLRPGISHELYHLEELAEVQRLGRTHDVEQLVEFVGLAAIAGRRQVAGHVEGGSIGLAQQRRGVDAMGFEVDHEGSIGDRGQAE